MVRFYGTVAWLLNSLGVALLVVALLLAPEGGVWGQTEDDEELGFFSCTGCLHTTDCGHVNVPCIRNAVWCRTSAPNCSTWCQCVVQVGQICKCGL